MHSIRGWVPMERKADCWIWSHYDDDGLCAEACERPHVRRDPLMIHADAALARRLEGLIRAEFLRLAAIAPAVLPGVSVECIQVGSGAALWLGEGSPVNLAVGLGMAGPVEEAELERVEAFYRERGAEAVISVCPLAHPSLLEGLGRRGWRASDFEHVLVLELGGSVHGSDVSVPA